MLLFKTKLQNFKKIIIKYAHGNVRNRISHVNVINKVSIY